MSPYASSGYRRTPNPLSDFGLRSLMEIVPSGTLGIMGARFALRQVAPMAAGQMPGIWQAVAIFLGAHATGSLVSSLFKAPSKGLYAKIAGLSFGGDLFARTRLLGGSEWAKANLSLAGMGDDEDDSTEYYDEGLVDGFQNQSALGEDSFVDSSGNAWQATDRGWALAGMGLDSGPGAGSRLAGMGAGQLVAGPDGTLYQLDGFQNQSALGFYKAQSNPNSSFGYSP